VAFIRATVDRAGRERDFFCWRVCFAPAAIGYGRARHGIVDLVN